MTDIHTRLQEARKKAGYDTASAAAEAMNIGISAYVNHENGTRGLSRSAERYAKFFKVSLEWLLTGKGGDTRKQLRHTIPIMGVCTAGSAALPVDFEEADPLGDIALAESEHVFALRIEGDSQYPRFQHGEYVIFGRVPVNPSALLGKTALVQALDGRRMLKKILKGRYAGRYTLESFNAPLEHDVELMAAWPMLYLIPS